MGKTIIGIALIMSVLTSFSQNDEKQFFYVGTFTSEGGRGIHLCDFNVKTGEISLVETYGEIENPAFLKISVNKKYLYSVTEKTEGWVSSFEIGKNGTLKFINKQLSNGADPCHIDVSGDGRFVAAANYSSGTIALYPVDNKGGLLPASSVIMNQGSGPDKSRQTAPHAHSVKFSPFTDEVFSADLGIDKLNIFVLQGDKLIQPGQKFVALKPGTGPRHFDFYSGGKFIFVIGELNSTISTLVKNGQNWDIIQSVSTLPEGFDGKSYCADIHVSADGRFLYGSNRGHNSIAVFSINPENGLLKMKGIVPVEGNWPRNFALSPGGDFLLAASQKSGNIAVFRIDKETGIPKYTGKEIKIASPVCIEFLK